MGLFRPYERPEAKDVSPSPTPVVIPDPSKPAKKDAPTPSRREAEAARRERLNPTPSKKEMRVRERTARAQLRDERFTKAEAEPGKVLVRDYVDAHRGIAQWAMPLLLMNSPQDHVVDPAAAEFLAAGYGGPVQRISLDRSYHVATQDYDKQLIFDSTVAFAQQVLG